MFLGQISCSIQTEMKIGAWNIRSLYREGSLKAAARELARYKLERDHWGDLGVDGWILLGWISRRWDVGIWTGLGWPRIETRGGRL